MNNYLQETNNYYRCSQCGRMVYGPHYCTNTSVATVWTSNNLYDKEIAEALERIADALEKINKRLKKGKKDE